MKLLLDTNILLWAAAGDNRLTRDALDLLNDQGNTLLFSAASLWEIAIKRGLGRDDFQVDPVRLYGGLLENGYLELPVSGAHALRIGALPALHKDPFDRMLLAQALCERMTLVTGERIMSKYPVQVICV